MVTSFLSFPIVRPLTKVTRPECRYIYLYTYIFTIFGFKSARYCVKKKQKHLRLTPENQKEYSEGGRKSDFFGAAITSTSSFFLCFLNLPHGKINIAVTIIMMASLPSPKPPLSPSSSTNLPSFVFVKKNMTMENLGSLYSNLPFSDDDNDCSHFYSGDFRSCNNFWFH